MHNVLLSKVLKANPYHGKDGRFTTKDKSGGGGGLGALEAASMAASKAATDAMAAYKEKGHSPEGLTKMMSAVQEAADAEKRLVDARAQALLSRAEDDWKAQKAKLDTPVGRPVDHKKLDAWVNSEKSKDADNGDSPEMLEALGATLEDSKFARSALHAHNLASGPDSDRLLGAMWESDSGAGRVLRALSALETAAMPKDQLYYRLGGLDRKALSTSTSEHGAESGSSHFKPDRSFTAKQMRDAGYVLLAANRKVFVGLTSSTEAEAIWLRVNKPVVQKFDFAYALRNAPA